MQVISDLHGDYPDGPLAYLGLENFASGGDTSVLMYGINCTVNLPLQDHYRDYEWKALLDTWSPCSIYSSYDALGHDFHEQIKYFDKIYTICPYTAEWINSLYGYEKMSFFNFPFDRAVAPRKLDKVHDVCYVGGLYGEDHRKGIEVLKKFDYRFVSLHHYDGVTDVNIPSRSKLNVMAKSKISVCYNLLYLTDEQIFQANSYDRILRNEAFSRLDEKILPQIKPRIQDSAMSRSLMLVREDPWNVMEYFYTPEEDFLYFTSEKDLEEKIREISSNWEDYEYITENAYNKARKWSSESFMATCLEDEKKECLKQL